MAEGTADVLLSVGADAKQVFEVFKMISNEAKKLFSNLGGGKNQPDSTTTAPKSNPVKETNQFTQAIGSLIKRLQEEKKALQDSQKAAEKLGIDQNKLNAVYGRRQAQLNQLLRRANDLTRADQKGVSDTNKLSNAVASLADKVNISARAFTYQERKMKDVSSASNNLSSNVKKINLALAGQGIQEFGGFISGITQYLQTFGQKAFDAGLSINSLKSSLISLTGSQDNANKKFAEFIELSNNSAGVTLTFAGELYKQLKLLRTTDGVINDLIVSLGKVNAISNLPTDFALNLTQIFSQGFEEQDIKQALTKVPLFREILKNAFGTDDNEQLRQLKASGKLTAETYLKEIARAINETPEFANAQENLAIKLEKGFDKLKVAIAPLGELIANNLIKLLEFLVPIVERVSAAFTSASPAIQNFVLVLGGLIIAIGPVVSGIGALLFGFQSIATVFGTGGLLAGVGSVLSSVALPLTAVIGLIVAFGIAYKENFLGIQEITTRVLNVLSETVSSVLKRISDFWNENSDEIIEAVNRVYITVEPILKLILSFYEFYFSSIIKLIGTSLESGLNFFFGFVEAVSKLINGDFRGAFEALGGIIEENNKIVENLLTSLQGYFTNFFDGLKIYVYRVLADILESLVNFIEKIPEYLKQLAERIDRFLADLFAYLYEFINTLPQRLASAITNLLIWIGQVVISIFTKIREVFENPTQIAVLVATVVSLGVILGKNLIQGVIDEISEGFPRIRAAIVGLREEARNTQIELEKRLIGQAGGVNKGGVTLVAGQVSSGNFGDPFPKAPQTGTTGGSGAKGKADKAIKDGERVDDILTGLLEESARIQIEKIKQEVNELEAKRKNAKTEDEINTLSEQILNLLNQRKLIESQQIDKAQEKIKLDQTTKNTLDGVASDENQGNFALAGDTLTNVFSGKNPRDSKLIQDYLQLQRKKIEINNDISAETVETERESADKITDIQEDATKKREKIQENTAEVNEVFLKDQLEKEKDLSERKIDVWQNEANERIKTYVEAESLIQAEREKQLSDRIEQLRKERNESVKNALAKGETVITDPTNPSSSDVTTTSSKDVAQAQVNLNKAYRDYSDYIFKRDKSNEDARKKDKARNKADADERNKLLIQQKEAELELLGNRIDILKREEDENGIFFTKKKELRLLELEFEKQREEILHSNNLAELERRKSEIEADKNRFEELKIINQLIEVESQRHKQVLDENKTDTENTESNGTLFDLDILNESVSSIMNPINSILGSIIAKLDKVQKSASQNLPKAFKVLAGATMPILGAIGNALNSVAQTFIQTGEFSLKALRKLVKEELFILSRKYLIKGIAETAEGFASLFTNPAEAAGHFKSAALFGVASAAAGGAGALIGIGTGEKSGNGSTTNDGNVSSSPASTGTMGETEKFTDRLGELIEVLRNRDNRLELIVKTDEMQIINIAARSQRRNEGRMRLQNITGKYSYNLDG